MKLTKIVAIILTIGTATLATSCKKDTVEVIVDSGQPQGTFTVSKTGNVVAQNGTGSKGTITLGKDSKGINFLKFGSDFSTELGTGTVSVYLSTSETFKPDPMKGNPDLRVIGSATKNGENYYKLDAAPDAKFTHIILWCGTAGIPFGNAKLQ
jgi:hypothetical protein